MVYTYLDTSWKDELEKGNIKAAIKILRTEIATNLMNVHNRFSDRKIDSPENVFVFTIYENILDDYNGVFKPFIEFGDILNELEYSYDVGFTDEEVLEDYKELESSVKKAMENI